MPAEPALDLIITAMYECTDHRRAHRLPKAPMGACNATDCPLHAGCPVLARQTRRLRTLEATDAR